MRRERSHMEIESLRDEVRRDMQTATRDFHRGRPPIPAIEEMSEARSAAWLEAAEAGIAQGQWLLGCCHEHGLEGPLDDAAPAGWDQKAAEQGDPWGPKSPGACYDTGTGVGGDHDAAVPRVRPPRPPTPHAEQ